MSNKKISISTESMLQYLKNFNYIEMKYGVSSDQGIVELGTREQLDQFGKAQKISPAYIGHGMETLYRLDADGQNDSMVIFDCVYQKIINEYLSIPGLESLFNKHFYDFEWDMHMEYNFQEMSHSFYRDHVEHQVRNMYAMLVLLDDFGFLEILKKAHSDPAVSPLANFLQIKLRTVLNRQYFSEADRIILNEAAIQYFCKKFREICKSKITKDTVEDYDNNAESFDELTAQFEMMAEMKLPADQDIFELKPEDVSGSSDYSEAESKTDQLIHIFENLFQERLRRVNSDQLFEKYVYQFTFEYIIRSACIICALFHDISYPLCHFQTIRRRVCDYMPSMNAFIHNTGADVDRIVSILKPSLLFTVVPERELRKMISPHADQWDHGVYSAITLLLSFYESGRISQLSADKQAAIEIAAVAIYNHNLKYSIMRIQKNKPTDDLDYYRPIFTRNPISFLLKLCDDLQEWDRKYFEFSAEEEAVFCQKCFSPLLHCKYYHVGLDRKVEYKLDAYKQKEKTFCRCGSEYRRIHYFPSRIMYTVTVCNKLLISNRYYDGFNNDLIIKVDYNPLKLLHMANISSHYAFYRQKELYALKVLLQNQRFYSKDGSLFYHNIYLDYVMTCNPIYIKAWIIHDYLFPSSGSVRKLTVELASKNYADGFVTTPKENWTAKAREVIKTLTVGTHKLNEQTTFTFFNEIYCLFVQLFMAVTQMDDSAEKKRENRRVLFELILNAIHDEQYSCLKDRLCRCIQKKPNQNAKTFFRFLDKKMTIYLDIALIMEFKNRGVEIIDKNDLVQYLMQLPGLADGSDRFFESIVRVLVQDCCELMYTKPDFCSVEPQISMKNYFSFCSTGETKAVYDATEKYCNPLNWFRQDVKNDTRFHVSYQRFSKSNLDYYSDLLLFENIGKAV